MLTEARILDGHITLHNERGTLVQTAARVLNSQAAERLVERFNQLHRCAVPDCDNLCDRRDSMCYECQEEEKWENIDRLEQMYPHMN